MGLQIQCKREGQQNKGARCSKQTGHIHKLNMGTTARKLYRIIIWLDQFMAELKPNSNPLNKHKNRPNLHEYSHPCIELQNIHLNPYLIQLWKNSAGIVAGQYFFATNLYCCIQKHLSLTSLNYSMIYKFYFQCAYHTIWH